MSRHVVIINGRPRSGKDTAVELMSIELGRRGYAVDKVSSIDCVRELLAKGGIDTSRKTDKDRDLLAEVGASLEKYNNFRTEAVVRELRWSIITPKEVVFVHMREGAMMDKLEKRIDRQYSGEIGTMERGAAPKVHRIFIHRDVPEVKSNSADANVAEIEYDYTIDNTKDLPHLMTWCCVAVDKIVGRE